MNYDRAAMELLPYSLATVLDPVFPVTSAVSRGLRSLSAVSPAQIFAAGTDSTFKIYDCSTETPIEHLNVPAPGISPSKRNIDRVVVLDVIGKVIVLAEGILSFHDQHTLAPVSAGAAAATGSSTSVKGVLSFAVDEDRLLPAGVPLVILKRKGIALFRVTRTGVELIQVREFRSLIPHSHIMHEQELPLRNTVITAACLRGPSLCYADTAEYFLIDLQDAEKINLLPISQDEPSTDTEGNLILNSDQRPSIAAIGTDEFVLATHNGTTTIGMFVKAANGEPCRGTVEWASNVRSIGKFNCFQLVL